MCIYPHQSIASFHPTSKDGLCGAHGREMEACTCVTYIAKSSNGHKLIKIVHICVRWMVDGGNGMKYSFYESLSPLFGYHEDMAIYIFSLFFFMDIDVSIFFFSFFSWTLMCPFFLFFWVMLLGHAIFSLSLFFE